MNGSSSITRLDIFSDPVCPWCYIGKGLLDRALEAHSGHPFLIEWHPFQLNPDVPREGRDHAAYLDALFGGKLNSASARTQVERAAAAAGLAVNFDAMKRMPNTLDAHRLIHWAGLEGRQSAMVSALFRAHFREGRDIGDPEALAGLAGEAGMDPVLTARLLATDADREPVLQREAHARERGLNAVPTFIIANQYVLTGAQPVDLWVRVIAELAGGAGNE